MQHCWKFDSVWSCISGHDRTESSFQKWKIRLETFSQLLCVRWRRAHYVVTNRSSRSLLITRNKRDHIETLTRCAECSQFAVDYFVVISPQFAKLYSLPKHNYDKSATWRLDINIQPTKKTTRVHLAHHCFNVLWMYIKSVTSSCLLQCCERTW